MVEFSTADLSDAHEDAEVLLPGLQSFGGRRQFNGRVTTLLAYEDNTKMREALSEGGEGRVLVVDAGGSVRRAMLGDRLAQLGVDHGWEGVVIFGAIRDRAAVEQMDIGVLALASCPRKTEKRGLGERDVDLLFLGAVIRPGMHIYADPDGVLLAHRPLL
ncbi:MAG: ribonuclease E activity regulator RraA [Myxococcota bacterium]